jgi:hypothetical protein
MRPRLRMCSLRLPAFRLRLKIRWNPSCNFFYFTLAQIRRMSSRNCKRFALLARAFFCFLVAGFTMVPHRNSTRQPDACAKTLKNSCIS